MKKKIIISFSITMLLVFGPAFIFSNYSSFNIENEIKKSEKDDVLDNEVEAAFVSNTSSKKTYYINGDRVNVYESPNGEDKVIFFLSEDDIVVSYDESNGYIYCENNDGKFGWIRKVDYNISNYYYLDTPYIVDTSLTYQNTIIYYKGNRLKEFKCSTGKMGDVDLETPIGVFYIQEQGEDLYQEDHEKSSKYYSNFFSKYSYHSVFFDIYGNIIDGEINKLGYPYSDGDIILSLEDAKWIHDNIPNGSKVYIHY
ncbi:MAG: L,D-transpeptidase family protein [Clostridiaceae bacterium]